MNYGFSPLVSKNWRGERKYELAERLRALAIAFGGTAGYIPGNKPWVEISEPPDEYVALRRITHLSVTYRAALLKAADLIYDEVMAEGVSELDLTHEDHQ